MIPHGRGRGIRPPSSQDGGGGVVGGEMMPPSPHQTDHTTDEASGSKDDRFEDDPGSSGEDSHNTSSDSACLDADALMRMMTVVDDQATDTRRISKAIKSLCTSESALRDVVELINTKSKENKRLGAVAAKAFGDISQFEVSGVKLRDAVLRCIQNDFKNREEMRSRNESEYLLSVNLLCHVYHNMRLADGTCINILSVPILEYFTALLTDPTPQSIQVIGEQTHIIGEEIQRSKPEKFADFLVRVRKLLVSGDSNLDLESRCHLLHVLESHLLRWPSILPEKTGEFYSGILGDQILTRVTNLPGHAIHVRTSSQDSGHHHDMDVHRTPPSGGTTPLAALPPGVHHAQPPPHPGTRRVAQADPIPRNPAHFRPAMHPGTGPSPRLFTTPPPNMLPPNFGGRPRGVAAGMVPPAAHQHPPGHGWQNQVAGAGVRPEQPGAGGGGMIQEIERVAADIMAIGLPPNTQVSPPIRHQAAAAIGRSPAGGGWQAMPPNMPNLPTNIPTAIVPPGVPPHNMPLRSMNPPMMRDDKMVGGSNWANPPPNLPSASVSPTPHNASQTMGEQQPYMMQQRPPQQQQPRSGGSGRIIPGSDVGWSGGGPGPQHLSDNRSAGDWNSSGQPPAFMGRDQPRGRGGFDIGTWENPGGGGGPRSDGSAGHGSSAWSSNDGGDWDKSTRSNSSEWTNNKADIGNGGWGDRGGGGGGGGNNWSNDSSGGGGGIGHWGEAEKPSDGGRGSVGSQHWGSGPARSPSMQEWSTNSGGAGAGGGSNNWSNMDDAGTSGSNNWNAMPGGGSQPAARASTSPHQQQARGMAEGTSGWNKGDDNGGRVGNWMDSGNSGGGSSSWDSGGGGGVSNNGGIREWGGSASVGGSAAGGMPDSVIGEWGPGGGGNSKSGTGDWGGGHKPPAGGSQDSGIGEWGGGGGGMKKVGGGEEASWGKAGSSDGGEWGKMSSGGGGDSDWGKEGGGADWSKDSGGANWSDLALG